MSPIFLHLIFSATTVNHVLIFIIIFLSLKLFSCHYYSRTTEGAVRDQIRKDVISNFESIRVWLFETPSDSTAALRTKLTIKICSASFKSQVQSLRRVMAGQLMSPTLFGGHVMTARTLTSLVSLVVGSLNKGETILPQSTYTGMIRTEVAQLRAGLSEKMQAACAISLDAAPVGSDFVSQAAALKGFKKILETLARQYLVDAAVAIGDSRGDMW